MIKYRIKNRIWEAIYAFLQSFKYIHTANENIVRNFIEARLYVIRTGCQWRELPDYYGNWRAIHKRYKSWSDKGLFQKLMEHYIDADREYVILDSTSIRAHACAAGYYKYSPHKESLGRSSGGFTTKIHASVDPLGNPLKIILTPGATHDSTQALKLVSDQSAEYVIADKAYNNKIFVNYVKILGGTTIIPPKSNFINPQEYDKHIYKERNIVERFFSKIKYYRGIFSRFDKLASVFLSNLYLIGALLWLN